MPYRRLFNFISAKTTQISVIFFAFPNVRKVDKFVASSERPKAKNVSASGGLRPLDLMTRGSAPGPSWGLRPQTPVTGSRSRARHVPLPNSIPGSATDYKKRYTANLR